MCKLPPHTSCDTAYGASIGRGAWTFKRGAWTDVRQDIWLNTPGQADGGFNIFINGELVLSSPTVLYRKAPEAATPSPSVAPAVAATTPLAVAITTADGSLDGALAGILPTPLQVVPSAIPAVDGLLGNLLAVKKTATKPAVLANQDVTFMGIMWQTFFGGHDQQYASPKDQYTYFNSVSLRINE